MLFESNDELSFLPERPEQVDDVIQDAELLAKDYKFHHVVDSFEIINFCFPIYRAWEDKIHRSSMIDRVVALYEVFYNHPTHPILLDEYSYELTETVRVIEDNLTHWRREAQKFTFEDLAPSAESGDARDINLGRDFSVILATAMGLFHQSFTRLEDVWRHRLAEDDGEVSPDKVVQEIFAVNRGSALIPDIAEEFYRCIVDESKARNMRLPSPYMREKIRRSSFVDAYAADRLFAINKAAAKAFRTKDLDHQHIFFYLSSAKRSKTLFRILHEKMGSLIIDGHKIYLWRTPQQILLRMIAEGESPDETRNNLETIKRVVEARQGVMPESGAIPIAQLRVYREKIALHYERGKNFGLLSLLTDEGHYGHLLQQAAEGQDAEKAREILKEIVRNSDWIGSARTSSQENFFFTGAKAWFTKSLLQGLAKLASPNELAPHAVRPGSDSVASSAHHLPTVFRVEIAPVYASILSDIQRYFRTPIQGRVGRADLIRQACQKFLELDKDAEKLQEDHELIRCLLFLALPTPDADAFALDHAGEMINIISKRLEVEHEEVLRCRLLLFERDFRYIACWAARRKMSYRQAERWAREAIDRYISDPDPRFYHARSLSIFSWFDGYHYGEGHASKPRSELSLVLAIEEAQRAIKFYEAWGDEGRDQIAALYNTIACLYVYRLDSLFNIEKARENLNRLKECLNREEYWYDRYPEYFHTEALVEYEEAACMEENGCQLGDCIKKLANAGRAIGFADSIYSANDVAPLKHRDLIKILQEKIMAKLGELEERVKLD